MTPETLISLVFLITCLFLAFGWYTIPIVVTLYIVAKFSANLGDEE